MEEEVCKGCEPRLCVNGRRRRSLGTGMIVCDHLPKPTEFLV